ncbi:hypothetical protein VPH35_113158 [Triticum aestivum]
MDIFHPPPSPPPPFFLPSLSGAGTPPLSSSPPRSIPWRTPSPPLSSIPPARVGHLLPAELDPHPQASLLHPLPSPSIPDPRLQVTLSLPQISIRRRPPSTTLTIDEIELLPPSRSPLALSTPSQPTTPDLSSPTQPSSSPPPPQVPGELASPCCCLKPPAEARRREHECLRRVPERPRGRQGRHRAQGLDTRPPACSSFCAAGRRRASLSAGLGPRSRICRKPSMPRLRSIILLGDGPPSLHNLENLESQLSSIKRPAYRNTARRVTGGAAGGGAKSGDGQQVKAVTTAGGATCDYGGPSSGDPIRARPGRLRPRSPSYVSRRHRSHVRANCWACHRD